MSESLAVNNLNVSILSNKDAASNSLNQTIDMAPPFQIQVAPHIEALQPYKPGRPPTELMQELGIDRLVNLASNENSFAPPLTVQQAIADATMNLNRYPDAGGLLLKTKLADMYDLKPENVCIGAGSESILGSIIRAFLHEDEEILTSQGTFIGLYVLVSAKGAKLNTVPLND